MTEKLEIVGGLKAALERGWSLEQAKQSLLNAGYNPRDIEDSSRALNSGVLLMSEPIHAETRGKFKKIEHPEEEYIEKRKGKGTIIIVVLSLIFISLIGLLFATIFAKEKLFEILKSLGIA